jgi:hypothetical protein
MATEAARLECKESTGRKDKTEREKHSWLIPAFSWKELGCSPLALLSSLQDFWEIPFKGQGRLDDDFHLGSTDFIDGFGQELRWPEGQPVPEHDAEGGVPESRELWAKGFR